MRGKLSGFVVMSLAWVLSALFAPFVVSAQESARRPARPPAVLSPGGATGSSQAGAASATQAAGAGDTRQGTSERPPDLSITARVTADSLLFRRVPDPKVEFTGRPRRETVWESDRTNLPEQVQPGVTYRDLGITLRITSVFADIERIVAEALGEIPVSDDSPSPNSAPATPGDAQPPRPSEPQSTPPAETSSHDSKLTRQDSTMAPRQDSATRTFATSSPTVKARQRESAGARRRASAHGRRGL